MSDGLHIYGYLEEFILLTNKPREGGFNWLQNDGTDAELFFNWLRGEVEAWSLFKTKKCGRTK